MQFSSFLTVGKELKIGSQFQNGTFEIASHPVFVMLVSKGFPTSLRAVTGATAVTVGRAFI